MSANLENSAVATRLEKVSFHFNPKEMEPTARDFITTNKASGKEYIKAVYCHLAYLTYMQST